MPANEPNTLRDLAQPNVPASGAPSPPRRRVKPVSVVIGLMAIAFGPLRISNDGPVAFGLAGMGTPWWPAGAALACPAFGGYAARPATG